MKFLIDQDVYAVTTKFLIDAGHDVIIVAQIGLAQLVVPQTNIFNF